MMIERFCRSPGMPSNAVRIETVEDREILEGARLKFRRWMRDRRRIMLAGCTCRARKLPQNAFKAPLERYFHGDDGALAMLLRLRA